MGLSALTYLLVGRLCRSDPCEKLTVTKTKKL